MEINKNRSYLPFILILLSTILLSSIIAFSFAVFIIQLLLLFITMPILLKKDYELVKGYVIIFIISMLFTFLVYAANFSAYGSPYYMGGSDDIAFEEKGIRAANANIFNPEELPGTVIDQFDNAPFFTTYMAIIVEFSNLFDGYNTFIPRIVNIYFLVWITMLLEALLKKYSALSGEKIKWSLFFFALTPSILYINSHVFRDTFNLLQILLVAFLFGELINNKNLFKKLLSILLLVILFYITYYTRANSIVFAGGLCLFILWESFNFKKVYMFVLAIPLITMGNFLEKIRLDYFIDTYSRYVLEGAQGGLSSFVFSQPLLPLGIFFRAAYALITPFPNFFILFKDPNSLLLDFVRLMVDVGVVIQIILIPFIIKRLMKFDWLSITFLFFFLGVITTTFTFRHVLLYYPFLVALAIDGYLTTSKKKRRVILYFSIFYATMLGCVYILLKIF